MTPITVTREGAQWIARFPFDVATKDYVKSLGFQFNPERRIWFTTEPMIAAQLDARAVEAVNAAVTASRAVARDVAIPAPQGLEYLPYQRAGIAFASSPTRPNVLIADEMGLGKTIEAIGVVNADRSITNVLVVCPASLKPNWQRELQKWLVRPLSIAIANGTFPTTQVVIINFDIVAKHRPAIDARQWDLLIVDEAHYCKNRKAQRTQAVLGKRERGRIVTTGIAARRRLLLTGTPIVNRPAELWSLVEALDPQGMGRSFFKFMQRYTNATHNGYGWDFSGAANLEELQQRLRSKLMIRRLKSEVLTELPDKRHQVLVLPATTEARYAIDAEMSTYNLYRSKVEAAERQLAAARAHGDKLATRDALRELKSARSIAFAKMSAQRHATAVAKIPLVIEHINEVLEALEKVVVFCHHHTVADALKQAFPTAALVTGRVKVTDRQAEVDRFQSDSDCRVFIGIYPDAAGVGWTLTAASHVVFAELDWVPGNVVQAEDRLHRIGQTAKVLVQFLVFDNSVDAIMAQKITDKAEVIETAMDTVHHGFPLTAPSVVPPARWPTPAASTSEIPSWVTEEIP